MLSSLCLMLLVIPFITCDDENVCKTITPCSCMFPNGTGIDLSPGAPLKVSTYEENTVNSVRNIKIKTFFYFPCDDRLVNITDNPVSSSCNERLSICSYSYEFSMMRQNESLFNVTTNRNQYEKLGDNQHASFEPDGRTIIYKNGPSDTKVQLWCAQDAQDETIVTNQSEPNDLILKLFSKNACFKQLKEISTRSTGSTLLIIFFTLALLYLVLGVCVNKFLMGAQGIEVIPNISFWKDLPSLCRDGWQFLRNGCTVRARSTAGPVSPNPSNYDSI